MISHRFRQKRPGGESCKIRLDGKVVHYTSRDGRLFPVPLDEVGVIGEYTTDNGPFVDDWFLVFVRNDGAERLEASMSAEGIAGFLEQLSATLGAPLETGLAASTDFRSRVIWPPAIAGRPLYNFRAVDAGTFLGRLKLAIIPEWTCELSADVLDQVNLRG